MGAIPQFLYFSLQPYIHLAVFGPSPFTIHLRFSVFLLRLLHISLHRKLCGAGMEKKSSPRRKDSPAGDKERAKRHNSIQAPEVFIPVEWRREESQES